MNQEENVYEETTLTEGEKTESVGAEEQKMAQPKDASAVLGKFKDVDALAQAYSALQAEFTRRSQRLRALEKQAENWKENGAKVDALGVEKLRKNAQAKRAESKKFDEFVADVIAENGSGKPVSEGVKDVCSCEEGVSVLAKEQNGEQLENEEKIGVDTGNAGGFEKMPKDGGVAKNIQEGKEEMQNSVCEDMEKPVVNADIATLTSEGLYQKACEDETVRLRIIGEYLGSIGKSGAPLTCGNAGMFSAPPLRAKTIADAGGMALHYFKRKN